MQAGWGGGVMEEAESGAGRKKKKKKREMLQNRGVDVRVMWEEEERRDLFDAPAKARDTCGGSGVARRPGACLSRRRCLLPVALARPVVRLFLNSDLASLNTNPRRGMCLSPQ